MTGRRIFIGDIQGCLDELERLLEAVRFDPGADELHPVGDFVNRGPNSLGTLELMMSLGAGGVLGNHDVHLLRTAAGTRKLKRKDTMTDVLASDRRDELLAWLAARPFVRSWPDVLLVHAGISPAWPDPVAALSGHDPLLPHPATDFGTRVRYCDAAGARPPRDWPPPGEPFRPWHSFLAERSEEETRTLVYGHWARGGLVCREGLRGLDTACVWGLRLTAWIAEEDRFVHVDAAKAYAVV